MRLIDADTLFNSIETIQKWIDDAPTIDAEPVRRGRWIREPNCWYKCSACSAHYPSIAANMNYNYCPSCGALMEEGEE